MNRHDAFKGQRVRFIASANARHAPKGQSPNGTIVAIGAYAYVIRDGCKGKSPKSWSSIEPLPIDEPQLEAKRALLRELEEWQERLLANDDQVVEVRARDYLRELIDGAQGSALRDIFVGLACNLAFDIDEARERAQKSSGDLHATAAETEA